MSHDVFISYSSIDKKIADAIKHELHAVGIRCWMAPDDLSAGTDWASELTQAIEASKVMVLVWTSASMASAEVPKELGLAMTSRVVVIPFRLENIQPEGSFKYHLSGRHWLDVYDKELEEAISHLTRLTSSIVEPGGDSSASTSRIHFLTQAEAPEQEKTEQQPTPLGKEAGERDDQVEQGFCLDAPSSDLTDDQRYNPAGNFSTSIDTRSTPHPEGLPDFSNGITGIIDRESKQNDAEIGEENHLSQDAGLSVDEFYLVSEMADFRHELALAKRLLISSSLHEQDSTEEDESLIDCLVSENCLDIDSDEIDALWRSGHLGEFEELIRELLALRTRHLSSDDYLIARSAKALSQVLAKKGDLDEALVYANQALKNRTEGFEGDTSFLANQERLWIATILEMRGQVAEANSFLEIIQKHYAELSGITKEKWKALIEDAGKLRASMESLDINPED